MLEQTGEEPVTLGGSYPKYDPNTPTIPHPGYYPVVAGGDPRFAPGAPTTPGAPASPVGAATGALDPSQSTLSPNFASYVYDMLGKGQAAANQPFQPFTGERFAGASPLQQQAFQGIGGLQAPGQIGQASGIAGNVASTASGLAYRPQQFANQFTAPGQYQAGQFNTGLGPVGSVSDYMSPYTSGVTDIAAREARRQADIGRNAEQGRLAQAGAYGGSRQAIMEAERQRNLGTQIEDISTKGLQSAYDRAVAQRQQEAQLGLEAQRAGEQSRQFGASQGMTGAQSAAQYGQAAQQAGELSRQFGANYGLQGLEKQLGAAQTLGSLGAQEQAAQTGLGRLQLEAGETQQRQAQNPLDFGYQQWQESLKQPYQQASYMQSLLQGLPLQSRAYDAGQSGSAGALQGGISALALYQMLMGK